MKKEVTLSAFVALVATVAYTPGAFRQNAVLDQPTGERIRARAINSGGEMSFSKYFNSRGVVFTTYSHEAVTHEFDHEPDDLCEDSIGIELNGGEETFCGLLILGFKRMSDTKVQVILRFKNAVEGQKDGRLEIPIAQMELWEQGWRTPEGRRITLFDNDMLSGLRYLPPVTFEFSWIRMLVANGIQEKSYPTVLEGLETQAKTYESQALRVSRHDMEDIMSVFREA